MKNHPPYWFWRLFRNFFSARMSLQESTSSNSPSPMDTWDSSCSTSWSSSDTSMPSSRIAGTKRKLENRSHYLRGKARTPFKSLSLGNTLSPMTPIACTAEQPSRVNACSKCSPVLYTLIPALFLSCWHAWPFATQLPHATSHTQKGQDLEMLRVRMHGFYATCSTARAIISVAIIAYLHGWTCTKAG